MENNTYTVTNIDGAGRGLIAARDIRTGEIILKASPAGLGEMIWLYVSSHSSRLPNPNCQLQCTEDNLQDHNHLQQTTLSVLNVGRSLEHPTHVPDVAFHVVILIAARESCTGKENVDCTNFIS